MIDDNSTPTNYYRALKDISAWVPENAVIIGEGANTMDIGRTQLPNRCRGCGWTPAAMAPWASAWVSPSPPRWCIPTGRSFRFPATSAIGFSGMEIETACRYQLPVKIVVLNNGGIGGGIAEFPADRAKLPPRVLTIGARYDRMMEAFGGKGWFIEDPKDLRGALDAAMAFPGPALVNVRCIRKPVASRNSLAGTRHNVTIRQAGRNTNLSRRPFPSLRAQAFPVIAAQAISRHNGHRASPRHGGRRPTIHVFDTTKNRHRCRRQPPPGAASPPA